MYAYIGRMKQIAVLTLTLGLAATPALAEGEKSLMERGAEMFLRGLMTEVEPAIDDLRGLAEEVAPTLREFSDELGPRLGEILTMIDDLGNYQRPEILPNGDIIMRRKPDAPDLTAPAETGEIDL